MYAQAPYPDYEEIQDMSLCKRRNPSELLVSVSSGFSQGQSWQRLPYYTTVHFPVCDSVQCPLTVLDCAQSFIHLH